MTSLIFSVCIIYACIVFLSVLVVLAVFSARSCPIFQAIASAGDLNNLSPVQNAIKDSSGGGHIADQFTPFLKRSVGSHDGGTHTLLPQHGSERRSIVFGGAFVPSAPDESRRGYLLSMAILRMDFLQGSKQLTKIGPSVRTESG